MDEETVKKILCEHMERLSECSEVSSGGAELLGGNMRRCADLLVSTYPETVGFVKEMLGTQLQLLSKHSQKEENTWKLSNLSIALLETSRFLLKLG